MPCPRATRTPLPATPSAAATPAPNLHTALQTPVPTPPRARAQRSAANHHVSRWPASPARLAERRHAAAAAFFAGVPFQHVPARRTLVALLRDTEVGRVRHRDDGLGVERTIRRVPPEVPGPNGALVVRALVAHELDAP